MHTTLKTTREKITLRQKISIVCSCVDDCRMNAYMHSNMKEKTGWIHGFWQWSGCMSEGGYENEWDSFLVPLKKFCVPITTHCHSMLSFWVRVSLWGFLKNKRLPSSSCLSLFCSLIQGLVICFPLSSMIQFLVCEQDFFGWCWEYYSKND